MTYRTRTYIAGAWTEDQVLISQLYRWNASNYWGLSFSDAHELTQARDTSLPCSIKQSLRERLNGSKTFVLVVSPMTADLRKGSCQYCRLYLSVYHRCFSNMHVDMRSFIEYECEMAVRDNMRIVVLYNSLSVNKSWCPEAVRYEGQHIAAKTNAGNNVDWNYQSIKNAIMGGRFHSQKQVINLNGRPNWQDSL